MKRNFLILVMMCLLFSGCAKQEEQAEFIPELEANDETNTELTAEELFETYLNNLEILETPVREYGDETGYIQLEDDLVARILYPETEINALNDVIVNWVDEIVAEYQEESIGSSANGAAAELTAEYDSYIVNEEIISIKITGIYDKPYLAHPIDIIKTFHANAITGELVEIEDILSESGINFLQDTIIKDLDLDREFIDEYLLDNWVLTENGLEIVLERGDYLPMSEGTIILQYSFEELDGSLSYQKNENDNTVLEEDHELTEDVLKAENNEFIVIDQEKPMVALTFDDGPSKHTDRLLDIFASYGGKGTFFVVGNILDNRADTLKRMAEEGHEIAGHSWNHRQLTKLSTEELTEQIMSTRAKIYEITGVDSTLIRPPYGSYNNETKNVCANLGIIMANWSLDTLDWKYKDSSRIHSTIMKEVKDGDIILCHDLHGTTVDAMERVIPDLIAEGYQLVTVSELLEYGDKEVIPGGVYNNQ